MKAARTTNILDDYRYRTPKTAYSKVVKLVSLARLLGYGMWTNLLAADELAASKFGKSEETVRLGVPTTAKNKERLV